MTSSNNPLLSPNDVSTTSLKDDTAYKSTTADLGDTEKSIG